MKIRNGFVSNSSSSSFVLIANTKLFKKALKETHSYIRHLVIETNHDQSIIDNIALTVIMDHESSEDFGNQLDGYTGEILDCDGKVVYNKNEELDDQMYDYSLMMTNQALRKLCKEINKISKNSATFHEIDC